MLLLVHSVQLRNIQFFRQVNTASFWKTVMWFSATQLVCIVCITCVKTLFGAAWQYHKKLSWCWQTCATPLEAANLRILWRHLPMELSSRNDADCHTMESHLSRWTNTDSRHCCVWLHTITIFKVVKTLLAMKPSEFHSCSSVFSPVIVPTISG